MYASGIHHMQKLHTTLKFFCAVLVTFILASISHSQFVLSELVAVGIQIPIPDRISMTLSDLKGLLPGFGTIIAIAMLLGFLIISAVNRWVFNLGNVRFVIAGALAMLTALAAMHPIFDVSLIAGARTTMGLIMQCVAGAAGGWVFGRLYLASNSQN